MQHEIIVMSNMGPIIRMSSSGTHGAGGVGCCCFRCCTCIHVHFFKSLPGIIKICETVSNYGYII